MANDTVTDRPQGPAEGGGHGGEPGDPVGGGDGPTAGDLVRIGFSSPGPGPDSDSKSHPDSNPDSNLNAESESGSDSDAGSRRNPVVRAAVAVGRTFVRDMVVFFSVPVREVRTKKLMAIPATVLCVLTIGVLWILEMNRPGGLAFVIDIAGVRQGEPIWQLLPQLPLSLFAPAPDLPAWGAMAQVLIAFGIAECWLGWKKMIAIAMITSAVTSMAARLMVYASNWLHIGTPQIDNFQVDTGPSVAVVSLLIYLALRLRTYWVVALTAVSMGGEAAILPNLAGREHLVAISLGIVTYFLLDKWWPAWRRRRIERATAD
ncbi:hypothetical protein Caci_5967 [Catenulispora acidiphila DSM 44928]|uniref:Uncharacterized protein n=1 Tax=Catenulispora acidiphila (strain DSM 44928 / JCM 14897 / NBRC 102108 / NRRL B-24433 / ID139908) TaxID=479433 RepID=C7QF67_CATAD|nr:hypothetical protein [Catenulispora acidiphila]ACU74825.1 hypothetical protein Caci_5967 [Catenulispora acidiphila DSM 44928]